MNEDENGQEKERRIVIDPHLYALEFALSSTLTDPEPPEYLTQFQGRIHWVGA